MINIELDTEINFLDKKFKTYELTSNKVSFENNNELVDKIKTLVGAKNLYLIVDCAINKDFKPLYYSDSEARILMANKYLKMFEKSAAHLVKLDLEDFFKQKETLEFIKQAIGQDWATFVISDKGLQELSIELKKVINIHDEVTGKDILFRFYDPRRLDIFFNTLTFEKWDVFTNKIGGSLFTLGTDKINDYSFNKDDFETTESENNNEE